MLQWIKHIFCEERMTVEERQEAVLCKEALSEIEVFQLDGPAALQLIKENGFPVREFHGTRIDN